MIDPERTLHRARVNLRRLQPAHPRGVVERWLGEWERLLDGPLDELVEALTSRSERGCELRQNSPFAGVLSQRERGASLRTSKAKWHDPRTARARPSSCVANRRSTRRRRHREPVSSLNVRRREVCASNPMIALQRSSLPGARRTSSSLQHCFENNRLTRKFSSQGSRLSRCDRLRCSA